mmetsp:Transcript_102023/g.304413  ORF Transcript_102023/g.304413 Transcript_102023/m.304413 type:complete len:418 (+) Transcript_102023:1109-2362(+)
MLDLPNLQPSLLSEAELPELEDEVSPERLDVRLDQGVEQRLGAEGLEPVRDVLDVDEAVLVLRQHLHEAVHLLRAEALGQRLQALAAEAALQAHEDLLLAPAVCGRAREGVHGVLDGGAPGVRTGHRRPALPRRARELRAEVQAAAGVLLAALLEGLLQVLHGAGDLVVEAVLDRLHRDLHARKPTGLVCHAPLPERLYDVRSDLYEGLALDEAFVVLLGGRQEQVYVPFLEPEARKGGAEKPGHLMVGQLPEAVLISGIEDVGKQLGQAGERRNHVTSKASCLQRDADRLDHLLVLLPRLVVHLDVDAEPGGRQRLVLLLRFRALRRFHDALLGLAHRRRLKSRFLKGRDEVNTTCPDSLLLADVPIQVLLEHAVTERALLLALCYEETPIVTPAQGPLVKKIALLEAEEEARPRR